MAKMDGKDLERLGDLVEAFYGSEISKMSEMDTTCAFLNLVRTVRERRRKGLEDEVIKVGREADALWADGDKRGATKLHERRRALEAQQKEETR